MSESTAALALVVDNDKSPFDGFARDRDALRLNGLANHPAIRPGVGIAGDGEVDLSDLAANPLHYVLLTDDGGMIFVCHEPGVYSAHAMFVPEARGKFAVKVAKLCFWFMFTRTDMVEVMVRVPKDRLDVLGLARALNLRQEYDLPESGRVFSCRVQDWLWQADGLVDSGEAFRKQFDLSPISVPSDRILGFAIDCILGAQALKGMLLHNRVAAFMPGAVPFVVAQERPFVFAYREKFILVDDFAQLHEIPVGAEGPEK